MRSVIAVIAALGVFGVMSLEASAAPKSAPKTTARSVKASGDAKAHMLKGVASGPKSTARSANTQRNLVKSKKPS